MTAFQFTPFGIVDRLGLVEAPTGTDATAMQAAGNAVRAADEQPVRVVSTPAVAQQPAIAQQSALRPKDVIKAARLRVKEIKSELRRLKALSKELTELERLLAAAKSTPIIPLRKVK